jgi:hypothetical protein
VVEDLVNAMRAIKSSYIKGGRILPESRRLIESAVFILPDCAGYG